MICSRLRFKREIVGLLEKRIVKYKHIGHTMLAISLLFIFITDVSTWIQDFSRETRSNWNVHRTYANLKLQQRKDFICHMSTFRKKFKNVQKGLKSQHRYKNCDCPAKIAIKVRLSAVLFPLFIIIIIIIKPYSIMYILPNNPRHKNYISNNGYFFPIAKKSEVLRKARLSRKLQSIL